MRPKELRQDQPMPTDFWNYKVNPIMGYYVEPVGRNTNKESKKYGLSPLPSKQ